MLGRVLKRVWDDLWPRRGRTTKPERSEHTLAMLMHKPDAVAGPLNYVSMARVLAATDAARYMATHMAGAQDLVEREALLDFALSRCTVPGHVIEFGVYKGASLRRIAARAGQTVHGFDSFEGLPEDWTFFQKQGRFSLKAQIPRFEEENIVIHRGWFEQTLQPFLDQHAGPVRFLHVDCDLYVSTACVLRGLATRIVPGTIIVLDEYLNYPGWEQHEYRAFQEFTSRQGLAYRYIGFASNGQGVAVQIAQAASV